MFSLKIKVTVFEGSAITQIVEHIRNAFVSDVVEQILQGGF